MVPSGHGGSGGGPPAINRTKSAVVHPDSLCWTNLPLTPWCNQTNNTLLAKLPRQDKQWVSKRRYLLFPLTIQADILLQSDMVCTIIKQVMVLACNYKQNIKWESRIYLGVEPLFKLTCVIQVNSTRLLRFSIRYWYLIPAPILVCTPKFQTSQVNENAVTKYWRLLVVYGVSPLNPPFLKTQTIN